MNRTVLLVAGIAAVAFAGGFTLSTLLIAPDPGSAEDEDSPAAERSRTSTGSRFSISSAGRSSGPAEGTAASLAEEFARAGEIPNFSRRFSRFAILCDQVDDTNAREIVDAFLAKSSRTERFMGITMIFGAWAAENPASALNYAQELSEDDLRRGALQAAIGSWATTDYAAARASVDERFPSGQLRREALQAVFQSLAERNPQQAIQEGLELGREGWSAVQSAVWQIAQGNPEAAAEMAASIPQRQLRDSAIQTAASAWAAHDHEAALAWVESLDGGVKYDALGSVVTNWARESPEEACAWIAARPDLPRRNELLQRLARSTAEQDPLRAMDFIELATSQSQQGSMIESLASTWHQQDPDTVREWAEAQTDASIRDRIWQGIISSTAQDDPQTAVALLENLPESERNNSTANVARYWGQIDPEGALEWASQVAEPHARENAMTNVLSIWIRNNSSESLEWFSGMPPGEFRDGLINRLGATLFREDPAAAVRWTSTISDPSVRQRQLQNLANNWMREDPASARQWIIGESGLPPEVQQQILGSNQN